MMATGVVKAESGKWRCPIVEHLDKTPGLYVQGHLPSRKIGQSQTGESSLLHEAGIIEGYPARNVYLNLLAPTFKFPSVN